jgi:hypothetical protein
MKCNQCSTGFEITDDDLKFYDKVSPVFNGKKYPVPVPKCCPGCRDQRRLSWRNEKTFYKHVCDLCKKIVVSLYPQNTAFPVYCNECWWSDRWDPLDYGQDIDFSRPFFEQYHELAKRVPHPAMSNDNGIASENSEYCQDISFCRNCFYVLGAWKTQDSYYCRNCNSVKSTVDSDSVSIDSELVYESLDCQCLYRCAFMQNSENCSDCFFGFGLKGCRHCFGCANLRQKEYYFFNQPHSKEEYERKIREMELHRYSNLEAAKMQFRNFLLQFPRKHLNLQNCDGCTGDHLFNCKDTHDSYCLFNGQYSRFILRSDAVVYSYDIVQSGGPQWCMDCLTVDNCYMTLFNLWGSSNKNVIYSDSCKNAEQCFGCISVKRNKYCLLNKRYTVAEYEMLIPKVITHMQKTNEWGEFFPTAFSPFGYNETSAEEDYPLTKEEVSLRKWKWNDHLPFTTGQETMPETAIPDSILDVKDSVLQEILACNLCKRNYKLVLQELRFYRKMGLPVPRKCFDCRYAERALKRTPRHLYTRNCAKCGTSIQTTYSSGRPEKVYCEQCYLKEVY